MSAAFCQRSRHSLTHLGEVACGDPESFNNTILLKRAETAANFSFATSAAGPRPATRAILEVLEAGESAFQTFLLTKTVLLTLRGVVPLFHACSGVKTLSGALLDATLNENG